MSGIIEIETLLKSMSPEFRGSEYVFCTVDGELADYIHLNPLATYIEAEGLTLILTEEAANKAGLVYRQITLTVHSSLEAVGLTAAVSAKLTEYKISANVVAAYYHDHIFVQSDNAEKALIALKEFNDKAN